MSILNSEARQAASSINQCDMKQGCACKHYDETNDGVFGPEAQLLLDPT